MGHEWGGGRRRKGVPAADTRAGGPCLCARVGKTTSRWSTCVPVVTVSSAKDGSSLESMTPLAITAYTATTAVGRGNAALADALVSRRSGLVFNDYTDATIGASMPTWIGRVAGLEDAPVPAPYASFDCRNHRLAWMAIHQDDFIAAARAAVARHGPLRVAVLLGTSTSTIAASEAAYRESAGESARICGIPAVLGNRDLHHLHASTAFVCELVGARGPCATISTACSSSAKVFAQAARLIAMDLVDAAVVAGVDSLAMSTLFGFHALGLVSQQLCRPFDVRRDGISIGEAAGFALLERADGTTRAAVGEPASFAPLLIGYGESSDAFHMSSPHPEGLGARLAIEAALARAGVASSRVDYINLHGTATQRNDAIEAALIAGLFPASTSASSTKGWTGHTLGAAGIVEAIVALVAMRIGVAPGCLHAEELDPLCGPQIRIENETRAIDIALSNAFAFGGNNCVLAFARDASALRAARDRRQDAR